MIIGRLILWTIAALLLAVSVDARPVSKHDGSLISRGSDYAPSRKIKNMVVFGDSYTDEGRIFYFVDHNGTAPPVGYIQPEGHVTSTGGKLWARFAVESTGVTLYNYAVFGASCSSNLTPRFFPPINRNFPSINDYELPAFKADFPKHSSRLDLDETLFTIWIGTNDIGAEGIISGLPNVGLTNYTDCVFDTMRDLYKYGARNFALLNLPPLERAPLYSPPPPGQPVEPSRIWPDRPDNLTDVSTRMRDLTQGANEIYEYRIPFEFTVGSLKEANIAIVDAYGLLTDIYKNPAKYLTGPPPLNVTGYSLHCPLDAGFGDTAACTLYRPNDRDSFMWYDELHPSEESSHVIGREFAKVLEGEPGEWITYW